MRNVSDGFETAIRGNGREVDACGIIRNGTDIYFLGMNDLLSLSRCFDMGAEIALGGVYSTYWKSSFKNYDGRFDNVDFVGACVNFFVGIKVDIGWEYISSGNLYITKMSEPSKSVEIEAYDEIVLLNTEMESLSICPNLYTLADGAARQAGLTLYNASFTNSTAAFSKNPDTTGITKRQVLGWCAQIAGGFIRVRGESSFNTDEKITADNMPALPGINTSTLEIVEFDLRSAKGAKITPSNAKTMKISPTTTPVTGISYMGNLAGNDSGSVFAIEDNIVLDALQNPQEAMSYAILNVFDLCYSPFQVGWPGDISYEIGDFICLTDTKGADHVTILMTDTATIKGGLSATSSAKTKNTAQKGLIFKTDIKTAQLRKEIKELSEQQSEDRTNFEIEVERATSLMAQSMGFYEFVKESGGGWPAGRYLSKRTEENTTLDTEVWLINANGFAYYPNGVSGPASAAVTADSTIVARVVSALYINADMVTAGILRSKNGETWIEMDDGKCAFGGDALTFDGTTLKVNSGIIGGWNIGINNLSYSGSDYGIGLYPREAGGITSIIRAWYNGSDFFTVKGNGSVTCTNLNATGGKIGGLTIGKDGSLSATAGGESIMIIPSAIGTTNHVLAISEYMTVNGQGKLWCVNADIGGKVTAKSGKIGGLTINEDGSLTAVVGTYAIIINPGAINSNANALSIGNTFSVTGFGYLKCTSADIMGKVTAMSGSIGGWTLGSDFMQSVKDNKGMAFYPANVGASSSIFRAWYDDNEYFRINGNGSVDCTNLNVYGGTIRIVNNSMNDAQIKVYGLNHYEMSSYSFLGASNSVACLGLSHRGRKIFSAGLNMTEGDAAADVYPDVYFAKYGNGDPYFSSGYLRASGSKREYKQDVTTDLGAEFDPKQLLNVNVFKFRYKDKYLYRAIKPHKDEIGFLAEDVAANYPSICVYDNDGNPENWSARLIIPPMVALIQDLYQRIEILENKLEATA